MSRITPEGRVKARIKTVLKKHGAWFTMPVTGGFGVQGVPDFLCCVPEHGGSFVAIEAKAGRGRTTALQDAQIAAIRAARGIAVVVNEENLPQLEAAAPGALVQTLRAIQDAAPGLAHDALRDQQQGKWPEPQMQ